MKKLFLFALCTFSVSSFALTPQIETASNSDSFISFRTANDAIYCSGDIPDLNPKVECVTKIKGKPILPRPKDCELEWGELFSVGATGKASLVCASDTPAVPDSQILKAKVGNVLRLVIQLLAQTKKNTVLKLAKQNKNYFSL